MKTFFKIFIVILIVLTALYFKYHYFDINKEAGLVQIPIEKDSKIEVNIDNNEKKQKTVTLYFIKNEGNSQNFVKVKRTVESDDNILKTTINELLNGVKTTDKNLYSEIPNGTKLLAIQEGKDYVIINLSSDFQYGGGTDSINNRIKQLIKTVSEIKTNKNLYLYLDGKQANVIGGEGVIINQPLDENSLED